MYRALIECAIVVLVIVLSGCVAQDTQTRTPDRGFSLVAYGDSFTKAMEPGPGDQPHLSWATGVDPGVDSVRLRLEAAGMSVEAHNEAVSGARVADMVRAVEDGPAGADAVLVFIGINDVCWPHEPTRGDDFAESVNVAFGLIQAKHPQARVFVFAVPDLAQLFSLHEHVKSLQEARQSWEYCRPMLAGVADPHETQAALARLHALNAVLRAESILHGFTYSDQTYWPDFEPADLNQVDYFHPNAHGQARLADYAWNPVASGLGVDPR